MKNEQTIAIIKDIANKHTTPTEQRAIEKVIAALEIDRCEDELQKYYKSNGDIGVISMQSRIQTLTEVKNDLLGF